MRQGYQKSSTLLAGSEKGKTKVKNLRLIATKTGQRGNVNMLRIMQNCCILLSAYD